MSDLAKLKEPFPVQDLEWRVQRDGIAGGGRPWVMVVAYITNRAIMDRLDDVVGIDNWKNLYKPGPSGGVVCGLSIRTKGNGWITKWDGADNTHIEEVKGGLSSAMKRAAVQWGIGRYLYKLPVTFAEVFDDDAGIFKHFIKDKQSNKKMRVSWTPPPLPEWAVPDGEPTSVVATMHDNPEDNSSAEAEEWLEKGLIDMEAAQTVEALFEAYKPAYLHLKNNSALRNQLVDAKDKRRAELEGGDTDGGTGNG